MQELACPFSKDEDDPYFVICTKSKRKAEELADFVDWFQRKVSGEAKWPRLRVKANSCRRCHVAVCAEGVLAAEWDCVRHTQVLVFCGVCDGTGDLWEKGAARGMQRVFVGGSIPSGLKVKPEAILI